MPIRRCGDHNTIFIADLAYCTSGSMILTFILSPVLHLGLSLMMMMMMMVGGAYFDNLFRFRRPSQVRYNAVPVMSCHVAFK